jgi:hypothetical protein
MLSISHAVTGAFIASALPHPLLFIPLAFISHFVLDYIIHYDIGVTIKTHHLSKIQIVFWESLDLLGAVILVALFWQQTPDHFTWQIWLGALAAITPDIIESTDYFFSRPLKILQPFYHFHHTYHHSTKNVFLGLLTQVILILALGYTVIFN